MQEEVESKSINLAVKTTSLTTRVMYNALRSYVQDHKARVNNHRSKKLTKEQIKAAKTKAKIAKKYEPVHGKQTVRQLLRQGQGAEVMDIGEKSLRDFKRIANKYGVDFAIVKDKGTNPPVYNVFFKARDIDAINSVVKDCTKVLKKKEEAKESIIKKLDKYKEIAKNAPKKVKEKWKEQVR
ncbi:MAG: PcfB family protein [Lachnospiraceae bacterium]|nr:PcfB family protein [Lachnospiraceae bacterium]